MEYRNLLAFLKVAELKHFTNAAEQLGYVQSTISSRIQQLEEEVGLPLFERIGKQVVLTPAGEELAIYAHQIVGLCEQARLVGRQSKHLTGNLRIGTIESLYMSKVTEILPIYRSKNPLVNISIHIATGRTLLQMLSKNELDIILILDKRLAGSDYKRVCVYPTDIQFIAAPQNNLCNIDNLSFEDILRQPLILSERYSIYRNALIKITESQGLRLTPVIELNNTNAIIQLLIKNLGISFLPHYVVSNKLATGKLTLLQAHNFMPVQFWVQLLHHKDKWVSKTMQEFFDIFEEHIQSALKN